MQPQRISARVRQWTTGRPLAPDLVVGLLVLAVYTIIVTATPYGVYLAGYYCQPEVCAVGLLVIAGCFGWVVGLVALAVRLFWRWRSSSLRHNLIRLVWFAGVTLLCLSHYSWMHPHYKTHPYLRGMRERFLDAALQEQIRTWAKEHPGFEGYASIAGLPEAYVEVNQDGSGITFGFGGGFVTGRGVTFGDACEPLPSDTLRVSPGVYVWYSPP